MSLIDNMEAKSMIAKALTKGQPSDAEVAQFLAKYKLQAEREGENPQSADSAALSANTSDANQIEALKAAEEQKKLTRKDADEFCFRFLDPVCYDLSSHL